uniref:Uncharacterized protein n=1 Tax=Arundo donax TaxID=35708 RepID=A0A0A8ZB57_ARUDO
MKQHQWQDHGRQEQRRRLEHGCLTPSLVPADPCRLGVSSSGANWILLQLLLVASREVSRPAMGKRSQRELEDLDRLAIDLERGSTDWG